MLCACGCGLPANPELGAFVDYQHAGRYERNGRRAVPLEPQQTNTYRRSRVPCPTCDRKRWSDRPRCAKCWNAKPLSLNLRAVALAVGPRDRYPLETTSADVALSNPCTEDQRFDARQRERGLTRVECPGCEGPAWQEPPCTVNGEVRTVIRCRVCDRRKCSVCGVRRPRWHKPDCAECASKRGEIEMATATNGKVSLGPCKYCREDILADPKDADRVRVTCGAEKCKKAHQAWLLKNPRHKQPPVAPREVDDTAELDALEQQSSDANARREGERAAPSAAGLDRRAPAVSTRPPASGEHMAGPLGVEADAPVLTGNPENAGLPVAIPTQTQTHNPRIYEQPTLPVAEAVVAKSYGLTSAELDEAMDRVTGCPILAAVLAIEAVPHSKRNGVMELVETRAAIRRAEQEADRLLSSLRGVAS